MRTKSVAYKGKDIYHIDLSDLKDPNQIQQVADEAANYIRSRPEASVLVVTNVENMHFNNVIRKTLTDFVSGNKVYIKASTIVGLSGLQTIIFNGVLSVSNRNIKIFKTKDEAMNWLSHN